MAGSTRKTRSAALGAALLAISCCTVMACSEPNVVASPPGAGSGGSGASSAGAGGAGAAAGSSGAGGGSADPLDASADGADAASFCCPPSCQPDCCMFYGGRRGDHADACGIICDNMPLPSAAWQLGVDGSGCPIWIEPPRVANQCCGCPPGDSGI